MACTVMSPPTVTFLSGLESIGERVVLYEIGHAERLERARSPEIESKGERPGLHRSGLPLRVAIQLDRQGDERPEKEHARRGDSGSALEEGLADRPPEEKGNGPAEGEAGAEK